MNTAESFDYIIVGGGSAGCVLANRLTACGKHRVLLIEAGPSDWNPLVHIPIGWTQISYHKSFNWGYSIEPEASTNHRPMYWPRGKLLGGSGSINGMVHIRGHREDFNAWQAAGCEGWGWDAVLPYFERSERHIGDDGNRDALGITEVEPSEISDVFIASCEAAGISRISDFNTGEQQGVAYYQGAVSRGRRQSSAHCYLKPARKRDNLVVVTGALCERICFAGQRATGVLISRKGKTQHYQASREVILAAGAINSPQLLQLSGVGPGGLLREHGIAPVVELEGVGQNLKDHLGVMVAYRISGLHTMWNDMNPLGLVKQLWRYIRHRLGLLSFPSSHVGAFFRSSASQARPDIQLFFMPVGGVRDERNRSVMDREPAATAMIQLVRPESRGTVMLRSASATDSPVIRANYLATDYDRKAIVEGFKRIRKIFGQYPMSDYRGEEIRPGEQINTDAEILDHIRREATTGYHPVGTCKMGVDELAVVDPQLQVHGCRGLRVVDASVMPDIIAGNTNAATVMIAEKASDMILSTVTR